MNSRVTIFQQAKERIIEFRQFAEEEEFKIKMLEFVTREYNFKKVPSDHYYKYVVQCLNNPTEIWQDEFSEKLQREDRILLTTLYSLTDTSIDENILKRVFNYRLSQNTIVDTNRNIWEDVLKRLESAFIQIIERKNIQENATEYEQIKRGFSGSMEYIVQAGKADLYNYADQKERRYVILTYVCRLEVLNDNYKCAVESFFQTLPYGSFEGMMGRCEIFIKLLSDKFDAFYNTYACLDDGSLMGFFWSLYLGEFQSLIESAEKYGIDFF